MGLESPKYWTGVILQGRRESYQWVTQVKISSSLNGRDWTYVDGGKIFNANYDRNTKVKIEFDSPVRARILRIIVMGYHGHPSLRFDAIFVDLS